LRANIGRMFVFGFAFFIFLLILSTVLHLPVLIWMTLELMRLGLHGTQAFVMPFHVHLVNNLWSSLVNMVLVPFALGAWTLFWYDCQARCEGLDLKLRFQSILKQRGLLPEQFF